MAIATEPAGIGTECLCGCSPDVEHPRPDPPRPGYVYRAFDADGRLLYIGSTYKPRARLQFGHAYKQWHASIADIDMERFGTHEEAVAAETEAIRTEWPLWNIAGSPFAPVVRVLKRNAGDVPDPWDAPFHQWRMHRLTRRAQARADLPSLLHENWRIREHRRSYRAAGDAISRESMVIIERGLAARLKVSTELIAEARRDAALTVW